MPVGTYAGQSTETPMRAFASRSSWWSVSLSVTTACLLALYAPISGLETSPAADAVFTTWPSPPCASMSGTKLRMPWTTPIKLTPRIHFQSLRRLSQR